MVLTGSPPHPRGAACPHRDTLSRRPPQEGTLGSETKRACSWHPPPILPKARADWASVRWGPGVVCSFPHPLPPTRVTPGSQGSEHVDRRLGECGHPCGRAAWPQESGQQLRDPQSLSRAGVTTSGVRGWGEGRTSRAEGSRAGPGRRGLARWSAVSSQTELGAVSPGWRRSTEF